jgi:hypothetical protein
MVRGLDQVELVPGKTTTAPSGCAVLHLAIVALIAAVSSVVLSPIAPCAFTEHALLPPACSMACGGVGGVNPMR